MITARIVTFGGRIQLRLNDLPDNGYWQFDLPVDTLRCIYRDAHNIVMELSDGLHQTTRCDNRTNERKEGDA